MRDLYLFVVAIVMEGDMFKVFENNLTWFGEK